MKRLLILLSILICLTISGSVSAFMFMGGKPPAAGAACSTIHKNFETGGDADEAVGTGTNDCLAVEIVLGEGEGATICKVELYVKNPTSSTQNYKVVFMGDDAGVPDGTPIANGTSDWVAGATIGADYAWVPFTFSTDPTLSAETTYNLVCTVENSVGETITWFYDTSGSGVNAAYTGTVGCASDWSDWDDNGFYYRIYK